jgi:hypothetical protein
MSIGNEKWPKIDPNLPLLITNNQSLVVIYFLNEISLFCHSEKWPKIDPNLPL